MKLAIQEARKGLGFVAPNPPVGSVVLDSKNKLIGIGYHEKVGSAHAEVNAINSVTDQRRLNGAHVIVTLEPCAHHGRTPPCAEFLAKLPIKKVTFGLRDPNPKVQGKGAAILKSAGIEVVQFDGLTQELEELPEVFLHNMRLGEPFFALKIGSSLDGQIAMADGTSQWITGEKSRGYVQYLRGIYDSVMIGANTLLKDNPSLDSRDPRFVNKKNRVFIVDPNGRSLRDISASKLVKVRGSGEVFVLTRSSSTKVQTIPLNPGPLDWTAVKKQIFSLGVNSVLVEGGAYLSSSLIEAKAIDRLYLFLAPILMGAKNLSWTANFTSESLDQSPVLGNVRFKRMQNDLLVTGRMKR